MFITNANNNDDYTYIILNITPQHNTYMISLYMVICYIVNNLLTSNNATSQHVMKSYRRQSQYFQCLLKIMHLVCIYSMCIHLVNVTVCLVVVDKYVYLCVCVCVCVRAHACVRAGGHACVRVCVPIRLPRPRSMTRICDLVRVYCSYGRQYHRLVYH